MTQRSILRSVLFAFGVTASLVVVAVAILVVAFNLRVELAGSGMRPLFTFGDPDDSFTELELNRSQHYSRLLPAGTPPTPTAKPVNPQSSTGKAEWEVAAVALEMQGRVLAPADHNYWTDFRGPNRDGRYTQTPIDTTWTNDGLVPIWKQPVGGGYASFVIADGRAFTIEQRRDREVVAAYDVATGRELWTHGWDAHFREMMGGPGPRATPTWHDGRLYALGAIGHFWCLDAETGAVVWSRQILNDSGSRNLHWAMAASPLMVDEMVIVQPGGDDGWSVVAYDRMSGEVIWHALNDVQGYTSPMDVTLAGQRQILIVTAERVAGLRVDDGAVLWEHPWVISTVPNIAQPVLLGNNRIFLSASYGQGAMVIELTEAWNRLSADIVWHNNRMKNKFSSSVLLNGYVYGLDESILACVDTATGELMWKGGRYGYGQLLLVGNHLVILTEDGDLALVRAIPDRHYEVARFPAIDGKTWNVPAIADGRLLVRNAREMAAFDLRVQ